MEKHDAGGGHSVQGTSALIMDRRSKGPGERHPQKCGEQAGEDPSGQ